LERVVPDWFVGGVVQEARRRAARPKDRRQIGFIRKYRTSDLVETA